MASSDRSSLFPYNVNTGGGAGSSFNDLAPEQAQAGLSSSLSVHATWRLLSSCNLACPDCKDASPETDLIIIPERLLAMAWRILRMPANSWQIDLVGGEPTLHPHLPDLIRYFQEARRDVSLRLHTNGSQTPEYYEALWHGSLTGKFSLVLYVNSDKQRLPSLLLLIAKALEQGHAVEIKLLPDAQNFAAALSEFGKRLSPELAKRFILESGKTESNQAPEVIAFLDEPQESGQISPGSNQIELDIEPDGRFRHSGYPALDGPIWRLDPDGLIDIFKDKTTGLLSQNLAQIYFTQSPLANPATMRCLPHETLLMAMQRLAPASATGRKWQADYARVYGRLADAARIYEALYEAESHEFFLRMLMAIAAGPDWLSQTKSAKPSKDTIAPSLKRHEFLQPSRPADKEILSDLLQQARSKKQPLSLPLGLDLDSFLDSGLWLIDNLPDWKLSITPGHKTPGLFYAEPPLKSQLPETAGPKVSIIVPAYNSEATIVRCMESALAQDLQDFELIIIDDGSTDNTWNLIRDYAARSPKIRAKRLEKNAGPGPARNLGLQMARGEFITFIDSDDCLDVQFLSASTEIAEEKDADIVVFDMVNVHPDGKRTCWAVEEGEFKGKESLKQLLNRKCAGYDGLAKLYRRSLLERAASKFADTRSLESFPFTVPAFFHSRKTIVTSSHGYFRYLPENADAAANYGPQLLDALSDIASFLSNFCSQYNLVITSPPFKNTLSYIFKLNLPSLTQAVNQYRSDNKLGELLTRERLLPLAACRPLLESIISEYATLNSQIKGITPTVDPESSDWQNFTPIKPPCACIPYGNADNPETPSPFLTLICANYNKEKYLEQSLASIFAQDMEDYEVIIVDDASTDDSFEMLADYADVEPRIRLYRMAENRGQSVCQNEALDRARGQYIAFLDTDDRLEPGFFKEAKKDVAESGADLVIYGIQVLNNKGNFIWERVPPKGDVSPAQALAMHLEAIFMSGNWGKIYRTEMLKLANVRFEDNLYSQDIHFVAAAIKPASKIRLSAFIACSWIERKESASKRTSWRYQHIHSGCRLHKLFDTLAKQDTDLHLATFEAHSIWNLRDIFLQSWQAYEAKSNKPALSDVDYCLLRNNFHFIFSLLLGITEDANVAKNFSLTYVPDQFCKPLSFDSHNRPTLSVIVPVYNQEDLLSRCLDSILSQSLASLEVLIIDDASADGTAAICAAYATKDARVCVFRNDRCRGQGYSRNLALSQARGEFITYVDSDDYILPDFFLAGIATLRMDKEVDIVCFSFYRDETFEHLARNWPELRKLTGAEMAKLHCEAKINQYMVWGNIYRKDFMVSKDIRSSEAFYEDNLFTLQALQAANLVLIDPRPAYVYCQNVHIASTMNPVSCTRRHIHGLFATSAALSAYIKENIPDGKSLAAIRIPDYYKWIKRTNLDYLASFHDLPATPLTCKDMDNLLKCEELLEHILEDYAHLYRKNILDRDENNQPPSASIQLGRNFMPTDKSRFSEASDKPVSNLFAEAFSSDSEMNESELRKWYVNYEGYLKRIALDEIAENKPLLASKKGANIMKEFSSSPSFMKAWLLDYALLATEKK